MFAECLNYLFSAFMQQCIELVCHHTGFYASAEAAFVAHSSTVFAVACIIGNEVAWLSWMT